MFKVLVANRFSQDSLLQLRKAGIHFESAEDLGHIKSHWATAEGLLIRSGTRITKEFLKQLPVLKVVISATSGFDHIDLNACREKNVVVMHTPNANATSAAEHTWGLILAAQRKYLQASKQMTSGQWQRNALIGKELRGQTLGIIGFGRIGKKIYQYAQAFEMDTLVHDPYTAQPPGVKFMGYEEVVRKSDIITYHVPLTTETKHMVKEATLDWFNDDATLINASRGDVVCMSSLLNYMQENPQFNVALDVFPAEPLPADSALLNYKNVFFTPHVGATTEQAIFRASQEAVEKMMTFVQNATTSDTLPPQTLWAEKLI